MTDQPADVPRPSQCAGVVAKVPKMANFKIAEDGLDISSFDLPAHRKVRLLQWGGDMNGNRLDIGVEGNTMAVTCTALSVKQPAASTLFEIEGNIIEGRANICAFLRGTKQHYSETLKVKVYGTPKNHPGYAVDLLADLAINGDARKIWRYSRVFKDPMNSNHILSQHTTGVLNCGDTAREYETKLLLGKVKLEATPYLNKSQLKGKAEDLKLDPVTMAGAVLKLRAILDKKTATRVRLVHDTYSIPANTGTHYATIIGYSGNKFLYIDPWPGGSAMYYDGGMYPKARNEFIGEFEFDPSHPENGIVSSAATTGGMAYKVIAGP